MMVMGTFAKFGALFVTIPDPIVGGMFFIMFGKITVDIYTHSMGSSSSAVDRCQHFFL